MVRLRNGSGFKVEIIKQPDSLNKNFTLENKDLHTIWQKGLLTLQSLQTPLGITASGQDDHFHAIFGRDSLWTVLLAYAHSRWPKPSRLLDNQRFCLNLHQHIGRDETPDLYHHGGGANLAKELAVGFAD